MAGEVLPNNSRAAWTTAETGFHSANVRSTGGSPSSGTNVLATDVSGKITMQLALLTTSGVRTVSPTIPISHDMAEANTSSPAKPAGAAPTDVWIRQPTARPVSAIT